MSMVIVKESEFLSKSYNLDSYYIFSHQDYYLICKCVCYIPFIIKSYPKKFDSHNEASNFYISNYQTHFYERLIPNLVVVKG